MPQVIVRTIFNIVFVDQSSGACASQPCENDGNCIEVNAAFICVCPDGFNGLRCENNVSRPKSGNYDMYFILANLISYIDS